MTGLLRRRTGHEARVGMVELFFDLVFVFAVTQLSHTLLAHLSVAGAVETAILFVGVWWCWINTSWCTNWLDPERMPVRLLLFGLMATGLVLSMSIADAWGERGLAFGIAIAIQEVGRSLFMLAALRRHSAVNFRNFQRITVWTAVSSAFWLAGGFAESEARLVLWCLAVAIVSAGPALYFRVPGLGRSTTADWDVEGHHMAERCGLFIIIALGESILVTGATMAELDWGGATVAGFAAALLASIAMWWVYFNIGAERASHTIAVSTDPGRLARLAYTYIHLPIVAGIIVTAASDELVLMHPAGHLDAATAATTLGGPALFLLGNLLFKRITGGWWPLSHLVGLAILAATVAVLGMLSPLTLSIATTATLTLVAVWETLSLGRSAVSRHPS
jgi:low temperature requirement protein LtrA